MVNGSGKKTILLGALFCGAGIAANAVTYSGTASTQELTYVLAWGAIIFGGIQKSSAAPSTTESTLRRSPKSTFVLRVDHALHDQRCQSHLLDAPVACHVRAARAWLQQKSR